MVLPGLQEAMPLLSVILEVGALLRGSEVLVTSPELFAAISVSQALLDCKGWRVTSGPRSEGRELGPVNRGPEFTSAVVFPTL